MRDNIIDEIHRIRDEHAKKFNYDLNAICEDYKKYQLEFAKRLVSLPSRKLIERTGIKKDNPHE
jgi:hypothetical protein